MEREYAPSRYQFIKGDIGDKEIVEDIFRQSDIDWVVNACFGRHNNIEDIKNKLTVHQMAMFLIGAWEVANL